MKIQVIYKKFLKKIEYIGERLTKRKRIFIIITALILLTAIIAGIVTYTLDDPAIKESGIDMQLNDNPANNNLEFTKVEIKNLTEKINIMGQIIFYEKINMSSKVNGRLEKINIHEGERVKKGQIIAEIERLPLELMLKQQFAELDIAQKSYDLSKAKYENAKKSIEIKWKSIEKAEADLMDKKESYLNMDRILKNKMELFLAGAVSESDLQSIKAQHTTLYTKYKLAESDYEIQKVGFREKDIMDEGLQVPKSKEETMKLLMHINTKIERAELEAAKAKIEQVSKAVESTQTLIRETYIKSPINGMVAAKNMEAGEKVKEDSIIATLVNISKVFVALNVNEKESGRIKLGQNVAFTVDAISNKEFRGIIKRISSILDMKTRTIEIKAVVDNNDYKLLPGMFARANIITGTKEKKLIVPGSSLVNKNGKKAEIYLAKKDLVFKQSVELGEEYGPDMEILKGIQEGDTIISKGVNMVYPGMKLNGKSSPPNPPVGGF